MSSGSCDFELIDQISGQINFLLLAQRNMILLTAFSLACVVFLKKSEYPTSAKILCIFLFSYAIAIGVKSSEDFMAYMDQVLSNQKGNPENIKLLNKWKEWVYFTYVLIGLVSAMLLFALLTDVFTQKIKEVKVTGKS